MDLSHSNNDDMVTLAWIQPSNLIITEESRKFSDILDDKDSDIKNEESNLFSSHEIDSLIINTSPASTECYHPILDSESNESKTQDLLHISNNQKPVDLCEPDYKEVKGSINLFDDNIPVKNIVPIVNCSNEIARQPLKVAMKSKYNGKIPSPARKRLESLHVITAEFDDAAIKDLKQSYVPPKRGSQSVTNLQNVASTNSRYSIQKSKRNKHPAMKELSDIEAPALRNILEDLSGNSSHVNSPKKKKPLFLRMIEKAQRRVLAEERRRQEFYQNWRAERAKQMPSQADLREHREKLDGYRENRQQVARFSEMYRGKIERLGRESFDDQNESNDDRSNNKRRSHRSNEHHIGRIRALKQSDSAMSKVNSNCNENNNRSDSGSDNGSILIEVGNSIFDQVGIVQNDESLQKSFSDEAKVAHCIPFIDNFVEDIKTPIVYSYAVSSDWLTFFQSE